MYSNMYIVMCISYYVYSNMYIVICIGICKYIPTDMICRGALTPPALVENGARGECN